VHSQTFTGPPSGAPVPDTILVDFDGTLAAADIGNRFFHHFTTDEAKWNELIAGWKGEQLSARECLAHECALAEVDERTALQFFEGFSLAPDAAGLVAAARDAGHRIVIASDGLELYVSLLLSRNGLDVPFSANRIRFEPQGPIPGLARAREGAGHVCGRCGNCKGAIIEAARQGGARRTVLVGDGYSDRCAAHAADVVYAKDDLLGYCREQGIDARPFTVLRDVAEAEGWTWPSTPAGAPAPLSNDSS
jgi:HAD superfamily phosphoserine phosphatase-like hydrolase